MKVHIAAGDNVEGYQSAIAALEAKLKEMPPEDEYEAQLEI